MAARIIIRHKPPLQMYKTNQMPYKAQMKTRYWKIPCNLFILKYMSEIRFYHLQSQPMERVLPVILEKALERGHRIIVQCADDKKLDEIDKLLWTYKADSFLPHGTAKDGNEAQQPVFLTTEQINANSADVLFLTGGSTNDNLGDYALCCDLFDGNDQQALSAARERWKNSVDKGLKATYWQQSDTGKWDKKAES